MKNHNILSHKQIKELTLFFTKQPPLCLIEKLDEIRVKVDKCMYNGYQEDLQTIDVLKVSLPNYI